MGFTDVDEVVEMKSGLVWNGGMEACKECLGACNLPITRQVRQNLVLVICCADEPRP